jgi:hypothetical protein
VRIVTFKKNGKENLTGEWDHACHYLPFVATASSCRRKDLVPVDQATCLPGILRTAMGAISNRGSDITSDITYEGSIC